MAGAGTPTPASPTAPGPPTAWPRSPAGSKSGPRSPMPDRAAPGLAPAGPEGSRRAAGGTVVLGGGFAGAYVARLLGRRGATVVSPDNFMLYTPMLPEAASGTLEPRHVVVPLRRMCPHAELLLGTATALDEGEQSVSADTLGG